MPTLYLVSTPIGNLEDITLRALRILKEVTLIAAEDTRQTRKLLTRYAITTPCVSYHEHSGEDKVAQLLTTMTTGDVALVSDAGTPGISDPGYDLVRACLVQGVAVVPVPGPSAPLAALIASGLPTDRYFYLGFLPRKGSERRAALAELAAVTATLVAFEAPHRLVATLTDVQAVLGDRQVAVARELTKLHEELVRGTASEVLTHFERERPRGEITLVIAGAEPNAAQSIGASPAAAADHALALAARLRALRDEGLSGSAASKQVAKEFGIAKGTAYEAWLALD